MDLQDTLEQYVLQLKNTETRTLEAVMSVCRKIMSTLYDHYFPGAEALCPGPTSRCPDSDILTLAWVLELIGKDSELTGYKLIKAQLGHLFPICRNVLASIGDDATCATQAKNFGLF